MTTETQEVADNSAPVESQTLNSEPNTSEGTAPEGNVETKQVEPEKTFTQAEVDALVQKRLLKEERRMNRKIEQRLAQAQQTQRLVDEPKREQFRDDDAYLQAQIDHLAEQKATQRLAERERAKDLEKQAETFTEKADKAIEKYPDFYEVTANPNVPINEHMVDFITESDMGADVAYFLGKNPHKAALIAQMSPVKAVLALKGIETELATKPTTKPSNAPAPINPIGANKATVTKDPGEMNQAEFNKWRKEQISKRGQ